MKAADELAKHVGVKPACAALEVSRSTLYRRRGPSTGQQQPRPTPARALSETERGEVFDTLCSERFVDRSPAEVVATLLDEEVYLCSERTMYRVLASEVPVQERRAQRTHPEYKKPELMATAPNQVWSWDITRLLGPKKWSYYYLYVIMDIYSRYVVGWMVADRENSALAGRLIQQSCLKHGVQPRVLTLHSDRGAPMEPPEVVDRPLRRWFAPSYKLRIVEEADRCTEPGEVGQLLRREGLYSSHLTTWRKAAHTGSLKALSKKRGRKPERNPLEEKVRKLERENTRLEKELEKAHLIIDVQGKVAGLLGLSLEDGTNS